MRKKITVISLVVFCLALSLMLVGCGVLGINGSSEPSDNDGKTEEARGTVWFDGTGEPSSEDLTDARNGDFYLRIYGDFSAKSGFAIYKMEGDEWILLVDMSTEKTAEELEKMDEFHIRSLQDLVSFADSVNGGNTYAGKTVYLDKDIDLDGVENWQPIGSKEHYFAGTFDGNGHVVSNMKINAPETNYVGFIGYLGGGKGAITNVTFKHAEITGREGCGVAVGCVFNYGEVSNITVQGATVKGLKDLGGIAGEGYMNITDCVVEDLVAIATPRDNDDGDKVGGIIGYLRDSNYTVSGCTVKNSQLTAYRDLGALVGCYDGASIVDKITDNTVDEVTLTIDHTIDAGDSALNVREVVGRTVGYSDPDEANTMLQENNTIGTVTITYVGMDQPDSSGDSTQDEGNQAE